MEAERIVTNKLTWHTDGKFEVVLTNGAITSLSFCEPGKGAESDCGKCLNSTDFKFLKQVYESLGDLFNYLEKENKDLGHTYALEEQQ